jgi:hypothetical protein
MITHILREKTRVDEQRVYTIHKDAGIPLVYGDQLKFV